MCFYEYTINFTSSSVDQRIHPHMYRHRKCTLFHNSLIVYKKDLKEKTNGFYINNFSHFLLMKTSFTYKVIRYKHEVL